QHCGGRAQEHANGGARRGGSSEQPRHDVANERRMIRRRIAVVITDQAMVTNSTGVAFPNGDVLGPVSENYEIKTKCSAQRDNDPEPNAGTRIPTISDFCHVERYASPARTEISLTISVSRYQSETFRDSSAPLGNDKHLQAGTSHCSPHLPPSQGSGVTSVPLPSNGEEEDVPRRYGFRTSRLCLS